MDEYPFLPEYNVGPDLYYMMETNATASSMISTNWRPRPEGALLSNNLTTTDLPSAFLSVSIPRLQPDNDPVVIACSIDARWAMGINSAQSVRGFPYIQRIEISNTSRPNSNLRAGFYYFPKDNGS